MNILLCVTDFLKKVHNFSNKTDGQTLDMETYKHLY